MIQGYKLYEVEDWENEEDISLDNIHEIPVGGGDIIPNLIKQSPIAGEMRLYEFSFAEYKKVGFSD